MNKEGTRGPVGPTTDPKAILERLGGYRQGNEHQATDRRYLLHCLRLARKLGREEATRTIIGNRDDGQRLQLAGEEEASGGEGQEVHVPSGATGDRHRS